MKYGGFMGKSIKSSIAKATNSNVELNKKALHMQKSWKEVESILSSIGKNNKKK